MNPKEIPHNVNAIAFGMGFGIENPLPNLSKLQNIPLLLDADVFYHSSFLRILSNHQQIILTPHPKEFTQILKASKIATPSTQDLQKDRISYALEFCRTYPHIVLVLKGANTLICQDKAVYINPFGTNLLAKGGSGDVLAGIIGGLLAQGYSLLDSAIQGVLLHSFCAQSYAKNCNDFSLSPLDLIEQIRYI